MPNFQGIERMRLRLSTLILFSTLSILPIDAHAAWTDDHPEMLINFGDLHFIANMAYNAKSKPIKLLDVRPRAEYDLGHIAGSIWVDSKLAQTIAARPGGLTDRDAWLDWITPLAIDPGYATYLVGDDRQLTAARIWWLLRYLGVDNVGLINGNFGFWKAQRRPVSTEAPEVQPHPFPVDFQADRLATRDDVLAALRSNDERIVDARSVDEWVGKQLRAKRGGHMPTACRIEWSDLLDVDGRFLPKVKLQGKIQAAGIKPGESVIAHCQSGGRASVDAFVFEMLGYPTRNYYFSWSDWGNADDTPITTEDQPSKQPQPFSKPFTAEYYYKCHWGRSDEFLALFQKNHLPILRERIKQGDILKVSMTKPRIHENESGRWDYRVTIEFRDASAAFDPSGDRAISERLFPDQDRYLAEERRRFEILDAHWDLPIDDVDLDKPVKVR